LFCALAIGTSMGNKERLKGILERQTAAAERERLDEEAASAKAEKVRSVRIEVIQKWQKHQAHLETYIAQINKEMSKNGVQLFVVKNPRHADTGVGMWKWTKWRSHSINARHITESW
jgi:L-lactate utilization protein LutB